jgi:exodeoxyribonuclease-3
LCLQETKVQDKDFPEAPFQEHGYHCTFCGQKAYNGVATLTRETPQSVFFGFEDGESQEGTRMVSLSVSDVSVVNTYVPQGFSPDSEKFDYKISWLKRLARFFHARFKKNDQLIWIGDFNIAPEPRDVYDPEKLKGHVGFHPEEHKALADIKKWGFEDVVRKYEQSDKAYSFWDYRIPKAVDRGLGWRIDHIWTSEALAQASIASWIDVAPRRWDKPSDHTFVVAEFDV